LIVRSLLKALDPGIDIGIFGNPEKACRELADEAELYIRGCEILPEDVGSPFERAVDI
jgi:hypothetical protein